MSKNVDERGKIATVVYGVACMAMWAARIVEGVKRV